MTWTTALWKAALWVLPNALPAFGVIVLFYIIGIDDPGPLEGLVKVLLVLSLGCLIALPVAAGLIHRSGKVALFAALCEVAVAAALIGLNFDFFEGWVPRGFHP